MLMPLIERADPRPMPSLMPISTVGRWISFRHLGSNDPDHARMPVLPGQDDQLMFVNIPTGQCGEYLFLDRRTDILAPGIDPAELLRHRFSPRCGSSDSSKFDRFRGVFQPAGGVEARRQREIDAVFIDLAVQAGRFRQQFMPNRLRSLINRKPPTAMIRFSWSAARRRRTFRAPPGRAARSGKRCP